MPRGPAGHRAIVLTPLQFERKALLRASVALRADVVCCGPGATAINRWADQHAEPGLSVILAGLAGGLSDSAPAGSAFVATRVVNSDRSREWTPNWSERTSDCTSPTCVFTSVESAVTDPASKRRLHEHSGAALVDMESVAFATAATRNGWRWAIVRGVGDDASTSLPPSIDRWIDPAGRTRPLVVVGQLLRRPWLVPQLAGLHRDGAAAMRGVAGAIDALLSAART